MDGFLLDLIFLWIVIAAGFLFFLLIRATQYPQEFLALCNEIEKSHAPHNNAIKFPVLPSSVERYLKTSQIHPGNKPAFVHIKYTGYHRLYPPADLLPIHGDIYYCLSMPGFYSQSRTWMNRLIWADISHRYSVNDGYLIGKLLSVFPFLSARGVRLSKLCLISYFCEAAWFPWIFRSSKNITWEEVDERTARLRVSYHPLIVTLDVQFNSDGFIQSISYPSKPRNPGCMVHSCTRIVSYEEYSVIQGVGIPRKIVVKQKSAHHEQPEKVLNLKKITFHSKLPNQYT
ncbi:DUF6544 family protein [uncultured Methanospirillum sp.]|uniref:DUF6544 family protein n=1 Tax=uncultured Methanospirillum sp. TaxID=262503 RepID=UPI0029C790BC|nr:DUF6544 family protein [uncultured Methanospirillum sp.]